MTLQALTYGLIFYVTAAVAVISAVMVVWHKNPVVSALYLVMCLFSVAVAYVLLHAHFLAAVQVLLYAGAVLVLFLMIIMLLNLDEQELGRARPTLSKALGGFMILGLVLLLAVVLRGQADLNRPSSVSVAAQEAILIHLDRAIGEELDQAAGNAPDEESKRKLQALAAERRSRDFSNYSAAGRNLKMVEPQTQLQVVKEAMQGLEDPEFKVFIQVPGKIGRMSPRKIRELADIVQNQVRSSQSVSQVSVPPSFAQFSRWEVLEFMEGAIDGVYRHHRDFGSTRSVGLVLFTRYLLPFEAASILLLGAIIGVMVLARRETKGGPR